MITRARIRRRAQIAASSVQLEKDEWNDLCDDAIKALWKVIVTKNADFRVKPLDFSVTSTAANYVDLAVAATDFNIVRYVCRDPGLAGELPLNKVGPRSTDIGYRLEGSKLYIEPYDRSVGNYRLKYTPQPPLLTADTGAAGTLDLELEQHLEFIVSHIAVAALASEESDTRAQQTKLDAATVEVKSWAANQRSADPDTVEDVRGTRGRRRFVLP